MGDEIESPRNTSELITSSIPSSMPLGEDVQVLTFEIRNWLSFGDGSEDTAGSTTQYRHGLIGVFTTIDGARIVGDRWLDEKQAKHFPGSSEPDPYADEAWTRAEWEGKGDSSSKSLIDIRSGDCWTTRIDPAELQRLTSMNQSDASTGQNEEGKEKEKDEDEEGGSNEDRVEDEDRDDNSDSAGKEKGGRKKPEKEKAKGKAPVSQKRAREAVENDELKTPAGKKARTKRMRGSGSQARARSSSGQKKTEKMFMRSGATKKK